MKIKILKEEHIQYFEIAYDNGVICNYTLVNGKLSYYNFTHNNLNYKYCDDIEAYTAKHWSDYKYHETLPKLTLKELQEFNSFDKLFYFGGGMDGKTIDINGLELSTPIILDDINCKIYLDIETTKKECEEILDSLIYGEYLNKEIYHIPDYNWSDDKEDHYTIRLKVKLPQDIYTTLIANNYTDRHSTKYYKDIFNYLKTGEI